MSNEFACLWIPKPNPLVLITTDGVEDAFSIIRTLNEQSMERGIMANEGRCPYIIGIPIEDSEKFFGREGLFNFIQDNLKQNVKVILLHGQRRIGKSSVLKQIPKNVDKTFVCVHFDLQNKSRLTRSQILQNLAEEIAKELRLNHSCDLDEVKFVFEQNSDTFSEFLTEVYQGIDNKNLVLLLDEFDVLNDAPNPNPDIVNNGSGFFDYLQSLINNKNEKLFIIPVVGRHPEDLPKLLSLFRGAPYYEIDLLDDPSAKQLITEPAQGILKYDPEAIQAILNLSAGHPFFTQIICSALFDKVSNRNNYIVRREDVEDEALVNEAIERAGGGLASLWAGLSALERVFFSAVAQAQKTGNEQDNGFPEDPLDLLENYRVIQTESLTQAEKQLVDTSFLDDTGRRVKIEFVRRWLVQRHPLQDEIRNFNQGVNPIPKVTSPPHQPNEPTLEEQVLKPSPNDVSRPNRETRFLKPKLIFLGRMAAVAVISALSSIAVYKLYTTPCPEGQQKILGVRCVTDFNKISYGERTFFANANIANEDRKWGIEAFKKNDYLKAASRFDSAVKNNPNDPEVLIYYNNALAKQNRSSPYTLAVIAPVNGAESSIAQEILRGVAQAQNEFNKRQPLNGRLLEIAIANDADHSDQAEQVAAELVKDKDVLGVIGHYSSQATQKALPKYEQAGLPIISPSSTSTELKGNVFFRAAPSDAVSGKNLAKYAAQNLKIKKVVIFNNPDNPYSKSIKKTFTDEFKSQGGQVVREIPLTEKLDAKTEVEDSLKDQAQAAMLFPDTQHIKVALKIAKANAEWMANHQNTNKPGLKLLGGDALYGDYNSANLSEYKSAVEGLILAVPWFRDEPKSKGFAQKAEKQWKGPISWLTAAGFDATQAFIQALSSSPNPSRKTVLQKLRSVNLPASTTSGEALKFTSDGESNRKPILVKVESGKYKLVK